MLEYIRSLVAIEEAIEPNKEQKRELRTEYREQGWLNTDEIRVASEGLPSVQGQGGHRGCLKDNFKMLSGEGTPEDS